MRPQCEPLGERQIHQPMPWRVQAAFQYLEFIHRVESYGHQGGPIGEPWQSQGGRELTKQEIACRDQATEVIRQYLSGEMDFGDVPAAINVGPDDDNPRSRETQPA